MDNTTTPPTTTTMNTTNMNTTPVINTMTTVEPVESTWKETTATNNQESNESNNETPAASFLALVTPLENDVLCSKDKTHSSHKGNRMFRERIDAFKEMYRNTINKQGKMEITRNIVKYLKVHYDTRFLKRDLNGTWVEISDQAARDKVSHALRFATRRESGSNGTASSSGKKAQKFKLKFPYPENATAAEVATDAGTPEATKPTAAREVSDAEKSLTETSTTTTAAAEAVADPGSAYYGRNIPAEHIEPSKWLLALRQGS